MIACAIYRTQPYRCSLQLLQQLPGIILVDSVFDQCLRHLSNLPLYGLQINQRRQRKLLAPEPLDIRLLLMLVTARRTFHRRGLALLPIPAEPLAPPIVSVPLLNDLSLQRFASTLTALTRLFHR